jgi:putative hydrolase of the HAD superfamily
VPIRAVFFDLGGTLFDYRATRTQFDDMLARVAREHGIDAPFEHVRRIYREGMARAAERYNREAYYLHRDMFRAAQAAWLETFGVAPLDPEALYEGQTRVAAEAVSLRTGVRETLAALRARSLHLGIVSNIDDDQFRALFARLALAGSFDATTTSEEARSCKPDARIYHCALGKTRGIDAREVLFVGDSPPHDFAGAKALGMRTAWITARVHELPPALEPDHVIREIPELLALVGA